MLRLIKWLLGWKTHKTLSQKDAKILRGHMQKVSKLSAKQQVIEYDKIYHHTLKKLGYIGSFGEILKKEPIEVNNLDEIWDLHKFRNTLVHELKDFDERLIQKQAKNYKILLENFINIRSK